MLKYFSEYIDKACEIRTGHTNWQYTLKGEPQFSSLEKKYGKKIVEVIIFFKESYEEKDHAEG